MITRLLWVGLFYMISRGLFFAFNYSYFPVPEHISLSRYLVDLLMGSVRFDLAALLYVNSLFLLLWLIPYQWQNAWYRKITTLVFYYIFNIVAFATNFIDLVYFRFTEKRMTFDIFGFAGSEDGFVHILPAYLQKYGYVVLLFAVAMFLFVFGGTRLLKTRGKPEKRKSEKIPLFLLRVVLTLVIFVLGTRGVGHRPLSFASAAKYGHGGGEALVLNTPFAMLTTINAQPITREQYFSSEDLQKQFSPIRHYPEPICGFNDKNVVIIILESFSAEYSAYFHPEHAETCMPCLDSLACAGRSLLCYANGERSMEAIPAIISNIPSLFDTEYLNSIYAHNIISGLPVQLREKGYYSAFFHGGRNGSMKFDAYAMMSGFDQYVGASEYPYPEDHDGVWGIYDDPFLQYVVKQIDTLPKPFFHVLFTLSSHPPYQLPKAYCRQQGLPIGKTFDIKTCVRYTDYALRHFMESASRCSWYNNTLFIFVADHVAGDTEYKTRLHRHEIPLIFYAPGDTLPPLFANFSQQLDIQPSILHLLNYKQPFFALGSSLFAPHRSFAINFNSGLYQFVTEKYSFIFSGNEVRHLAFREDTLQANLLDQSFALPREDLNFARAVIQTYQTAILENRYTLKRWLPRNAEEN
jgi:phosphoglycerol transferase MdoB-like AlkP superfamily enzyme